MKFLNRLIEKIDGREYNSLTKYEKKDFLNQQYWTNHDAYLFITSSFFVLESLLYLLALKKILYIQPEYYIFYLLTFCLALLFFGSLTVFFILQRRTRSERIKNLRIDKFIWIAFIAFMFLFTAEKISSDCQQMVYAIVIMLYVFLFKVRPFHSVLLFSVLFSVMVFYADYLGMSHNIKLGLVINCFILDFFALVINRNIFSKSVQDYINRKTILKQNMELEYISLHDPLTGLANRRSFENRIANQKIEIPSVLCIMDLDGLKLINDAFGHYKGDFAIKIVSDLLKKFFIDDFKARIGGDEFVIIIESATTESVEEKIRHLSDELKKTKVSGIAISVSTGCDIIYSRHLIKDAFKRAENIMYHKKLTERGARKEYAMQTLLSALYDHTLETQRHCYYVAVLSQIILSKFKESAYNLESIKTAGMLHDIGKLSIPAYILHKRTPLEEKEREILRQHCENGFKIASSVIDDFKITGAILHHHENYDGTGYPMGLKNRDIPFFARIIAVADSFDAMVSKRAYTTKRDLREARFELRRCSGTQFDPEVVNKFLCIPLEELPY